MPDALALELVAPAKLNLMLSVGAPIPPRGYHPICSWFVPIDLHDSMTLTRLPDGSPSEHEIAWAADAPRASPIDWPLDRDLAVRAHRMLETHVGRPLPLHMRLLKRVPVGGGLGGGSSDAAAMLRGVNELFRLGLPARQLATLGSQLGSDVAFFLDDLPVDAAPRPAIVAGFGEIIDRVPVVPAELLLVAPAFGCNTAAVYRAFDDQDPDAALRTDEIRSTVHDAAAASRIDPARLFNDLLAPARRVEPRLDHLINGLRTALAATGDAVHMTGSGSTLFVLPEGSAADLACLIRAGFPTLAVIEARAVGGV